MYIKIKDVKVPVVIKSYKSSKTIKMYFKNGIFTITKPTYVTKYKINEMIKKHEEEIYNEYQKVIEQQNAKKNWYEKETFYYKGQKYKIVFNEIGDKKIIIKINDDEKILEIKVLKNLSKESRKEYLDKGIKKFLKSNTQEIIDKKLLSWSNKTNIKYKTVQVRDAISKYGSCTVGKKALHFSSRLVMLPDDVIDAIIVHELCHIIHPNHSKEFYNLVETFIPNYKKIDIWLKKNGNLIML